MVLHFLLASAFASSFNVKPLPELTEEARFIVHGTLHNIRTESGIESSGAKIIYTYATLDLTEKFKGSGLPQTILIRKIGGTQDGLTIDIPGSPEFKNGEECVLFLSEEKEDQSYEILGLEMGKYGLEEKNGQTILTGGIFNYSSHDRPTPYWTLSKFKVMLAKQIAKTLSLPKPLAQRASLRDEAIKFPTSSKSTPPLATLLSPSILKSPASIVPILILLLGATLVLLFSFRNRKAKPRLKRR